MAPLLDSTMAKFGVLLDVLLRHRQALSYGLTTLLTAGGERLFSNVVFQCPCSATWNLPYGLVFLLVPAGTLALLAWALRGRLWLWVSGCCAGCCGCCEGLCGCCLGCCNRCLRLCCCYVEPCDCCVKRCSCSAEPCRCKVKQPRPKAMRPLNMCLELAAVPLLVFSTWVTVGLLGGTFYQCMATGHGPLARSLCAGLGDNCSALLARLPCTGDPPPRELQHLSNLLNDLRSFSQVLGWGLVSVMVVCSLVTMCIAWGRSSTSFMQFKFWKIYWAQEKEIFTKEATEHARILAKKNTERFFEKVTSGEQQIPEAKHWEEISTVFAFSSDKKKYYSSLHRYVNEGAGGANIPAEMSAVQSNPEMHLLLNQDSDNQRPTQEDNTTSI